MKILIICTYFPPDTNIATKRPYMFAKYLAEFGHDVTVLCSGVISKKKDDLFNEYLNKFKVVYYLKESIGKEHALSVTMAHRNSGLVPSVIRKKVKKMYHVLCEPYQIYKTRQRTGYHFQYIKAALDALKYEHFDVVYSTYSELSNVYAGAYAKELYDCKWIMDFRDRIVQHSNRSWLWNTLYKPIERKYIEKADVVTTVSEDLFHGTPYPSSKIYTIYNGFEPMEVGKNLSSEVFRVSFCYTGMIYGDRTIALESFFKILFSLKSRGLIKVENISFDYAGQSGEVVDRMASKYGLEAIVNQHGYLLSKEVKQLQLNSDVFLVLSWNYVNERGVLTGKFYDGIKVKKPILSILAGDTPDSELFRLNEKYHYGFCYEQARRNQQDNEFESFILDIYNQKTKRGELDYQINEILINKFKYENLTKELESLCFSLLSK